MSAASPLANATLTSRLASQLEHQARFANRWAIAGLAAILLSILGGLYFYIYGAIQIATLDERQRAAARTAGREEAASAAKVESHDILAKLIKQRERWVHAQENYTDPLSQHSLPIVRIVASAAGALVVSDDNQIAQINQDSDVALFALNPDKRPIIFSPAGEFFGWFANNVSSEVEIVRVGSTQTRRIPLATADAPQVTDRENVRIAALSPGALRLAVFDRTSLSLYELNSAKPEPVRVALDVGALIAQAYSPGGGNDLIARIVAARLQTKLNQPVIVENKPGAQSIVAAELVAKAAPDGYTLLIAPSGPMTINPAVYAKLPYDAVKDFVPVTMLAEFPLLLVVGAEQPVKSVKELVDYARANPTLANYASSATPFQLASELFNARTQSKFQHIPYKGSGDAVQSVMSGQVLMALADSGPIAAPLKAGKLRALAITTARRPPDFPDVPTMAEAGVPDMDIALWTGLVAPAGTSPQIVMLLQDVIADILEEPAIRNAFDAILVDARSMSSREFAEVIVRDGARWKQVAASANVKID